MQIRNVGRSGLRVSLLGLGCNNFGIWIDLAAARQVVNAALEAGITVFDTADVYGTDGASETMLGEALGARRNDVVIMTKTGYAPNPADCNGSRRQIISACEASLRRLGTDWIDVYYLHCPDGRTPIEETLRAMDDLIRAGKVRYTACSNLPAWQLADADWTARDRNLSPFIAAQDEYSLLSRGIESEKLPALEHYGLGLIPYFPLANGLLTGKYKSLSDYPAHSRLATTPSLASQYLTENNIAQALRLQTFAQERGRSLLELAFGWLATRRCVASIIAGATSEQQVKLNRAALDRPWSAADLSAVDTLGR
jgi:aryl-alcohol dehydrogenase-like predicted oxidoreductase